MHLLVETALGDGQEYEVVSFEEVDEMKKEYSLLSNRIDASKRKLALESKVRDAAQSLGRLTKKGRSDSTESSPKQRRSFLGSRKSDQFDRADDEAAISTRKCEDLAQEIWRLEKRASEIQRRLLQHTAGILQMTHRGIIKGGPGVQNGTLQAPRGDSIAGAYPYSNGGSSLSNPDEEDDFDHRSLYRSHDSLDPESNQQVATAEKKLGNLNNRLHGMIVQVNPQLSNSYKAPPSQQANGVSSQSGPKLQAQLDYLEQSLATFDRQQHSLSRSVQQAESATEERLEGLNNQLYDVMNLADQQKTGRHQSPPPATGQNLQAQMTYLEDGLDKIEQHLQSSSKGAEQQGRAGQYETVLLGLWDILQSGEEEVRQRKRQRRQARSANPDENDSDVSADEESVPNESFSLDTFSAKVQILCARTTNLMEQKEILRRQVKQQRRLNSKADPNDVQVAQLTKELDQTRQALHQSDQDLINARQELTLVMQRLDAARREWANKEQQRGNDDSAAVRDLKQGQDALRKLQATLDQAKVDHGTARNELQVKMQALEAELRSAVQAKDAALANEAELKQLADAKTKQAEKVQAEMKELEGEVVRLQTEVTVARAELDGAYGTRAQRAAEVAANPAIQKELDELGEKNVELLSEIASLRAAQQASGSGSTDQQQRIEILQRELSETISDYEVMTKQIIEFEKERESMESAVDSLRDKCEALESDLSDERVRWMGIKSPTSAGTDGPTQTTSTTVLKNEFKKMMRDLRAENVKVLRVSLHVHCRALSSLP